MMKILVPFSHSELGGSQLFFLKTSELLRNEVEFLVWLQEEGPLQAELERRKIRTRVWTGPSWKNPLSWPSVLAGLKRENPDLVYLHGPRTLALMARLAGVPCLERINMTRIPEAGGWMRFPFLDRIMTGWNTHLLAVAGAIAAQLEALGIPRSKITVVHNHVDEAQWRRPELRAAMRQSLGLDGRDTLVLGAGRLVPQKAPLDFFRVAEQLDNRRHMFLWAGEGPLAGEVEAFNRSLATRGHRARLIPFQADLAPLMNAADILLHCSHWDPLANVLLEAMAAGLPIVASDVDGSGEALKAYPPSRRVPPGDIPGFAAALTALSGTPIPAANLPAEFRPERFRGEILGLFSRVAGS